MKRALLVVALLAVMSGFHGIAYSAEGEDHSGTTVQGEIIDMACFLAHGAKGADHAGCAVQCVKGGQPMGLLAEDGTIYVLYASHSDASAFDQAKEFAGKKVEITGAKANQGGVNGIEVHGVKQL